MLFLSPLLFLRFKNCLSVTHTSHFVSSLFLTAVKEGKNVVVKKTNSSDFYFLRLFFVV